MRFELAISCLLGRCFNQLSHGMEPTTKISQKNFLKLKLLMLKKGNITVFINQKKTHLKLEFLTAEQENTHLWCTQCVFCQKSSDLCTIPWHQLLMFQAHCSGFCFYPTKFRCQTQLCRDRCCCWFLGNMYLV